MAVKEFPLDYWVKSTGKRNRANVLAHLVRHQSGNMFPRRHRPPVSVQALSDQGWMNFALHLNLGDGKHAIMRLTQKGRSTKDKNELWSPFHKEKWVIERLPSSIPLPTYLEPGIGYTMISNIGGVPKQEYAFSLQEFLPFQPASKVVGPAHRIEFLERLSSKLSEVNRATSDGFGDVFDSTLNKFSFSSWSEYLENKIDSLELPRLTKEDLLPHSMAERIRISLNGLSSICREPTICHLDIINNISNVLVDDNLEIKALLDWEFSASGPGVLLELANTFYVWIRDGVPLESVKEEVSAILRGYKISNSEFNSELKEVLEALMEINALSALQKFLHIKDRKELEKEPWRKTFAERAKSFLDQGLKVSL